MTSREKYMFMADIIFALLSIWFLLPRCKMALWLRLILVAFVWGINMWFSYHDNNVMWLFTHGHYYSPLCLFVALAAFFGWKTNVKRGPSLDASSDEFVKKHQRLLWCAVVMIFLLIPIVVYWILH
jgi:hypothetical protein